MTLKNVKSCLTWFFPRVIIFISDILILFLMTVDGAHSSQSIRSYRLFIVNKNKLNTLLIEKTINWLCFRWLYWTNKWSLLNFQNLRSILRLYRFGNTAIVHTFYLTIFQFVIYCCSFCSLQGCVASLETYQSSRKQRGQQSIPNWYMLSL